jgi:hypothetical protein
MIVRDRLIPTDRNPVERAREMFRGERDLDFYELWRDVRRPEELHQQMEYLRSRSLITRELMEQVGDQLEDQERAATYVSASGSTEIADVVDHSVSDVVLDAYDGSIRPVMRYVRPATGEFVIEGTTDFRDERVLVGLASAIRIRSDNANYCGFYISGATELFPGNLDFPTRAVHGLATATITPSPGVSLDMDESEIVLSFPEPTQVMLWGWLFAKAVYGRLAVMQTRALNEKLRVPNGLALPGGVRWEYSTDGSTWLPGLNITDSEGAPYVHRVGRGTLPLQISVGDAEASAVTHSGVNRPTDGKIDIPHWVIPETLTVYRDLDCWMIEEVKLTGTPMTLSSDGSRAEMELSGETFESLHTARRANDEELMERDAEFAALSDRQVDLTAAVAESHAMFRRHEQLARGGRKQEQDLRTMANALLIQANETDFDSDPYPFDRFYVGLGANPLRPFWGTAVGSRAYHLPETRDPVVWRTREQWSGMTADGQRRQLRAIATWLIARATEINVETTVAERDMGQGTSFRRRLRKSRQLQDVKDRMDEIRSVETVSVNVPMTPAVFERMLLDDSTELNEMVTAIQAIADRAGVTLGTEASVQALIDFKDGQRLLDEGRLDEFITATESLEQHFRNLGGLLPSRSNLSFLGESEGRVSTFLYSDKVASLQVAIPVDYMIPDAEQIYLRSAPVMPQGQWTQAGVNYWVFPVPLAVGQNAISFRSRLVASAEVAALDVGFLRDGAFYSLNLEEAGVVVSPHLPARAIDFDAYKHYVEERRRFEVVGLKNDYDGDAGGWLTEIWIQPPSGHATPDAAVFLDYRYRDDTPTAIRATDEDFYLRTTLVSEPDRPMRIPRMQVGYRL